MVVNIDVLRCAVTTQHTFYKVRRVFPALYRRLEGAVQSTDAAVLVRTAVAVQFWRVRPLWLPE